MTARRQPGFLCLPKRLSQFGLDLLYSLADILQKIIVEILQRDSLIEAIKPATDSLSCPVNQAMRFFARNRA